MGGGRSSPRLIEELLAYAPGRSMFTVAPTAAQAFARAPPDALLIIYQAGTKRGGANPHDPAVKDEFAHSIEANGSVAPAADAASASVPGQLADEPADGEVRAAGLPDTHAAATATDVPDSAGSDSAPLASTEPSTNGSPAARGSAPENSVRILRGIFANSFVHFEAQVSPPLVNCDCDWHIIEAPPRADGVLVHVVYQCSLCLARLDIRLLPPALSPMDLSTFDSREITSRWRQFDPSRNHPPTTAQSVDLLDKVVSNVLLFNDPRSIRKSNPKAAVAFEMDLLSRVLGFTYDKEADSYIPPTLDSAGKERYARIRRELNLYALTLGQKSNDWVKESIEPELYSFFDCSGAARQIPTPLSSREYGVLGACENFTDELIWDRYRLQITNDPRHTPHYLEALTNVAQDRKSEFLETKVMELISLGTPTLSNLREAYNSLGLPLEDGGGDEASDEVILEIYLQKIKHMPDAQASLANDLRLIADSRQSPILNRAVSASVMNINESYAVFGIDFSVPDAVVAERFKRLMTGTDVMALEARTALYEIALDRRSPQLLNLYEESFPEELDSSSALNLLGVAETMDDKSVITVFEMIVAESSASELLKLRRALKVIGFERKSSFIESFLETGVSDEPAPPLNAPVGLWNIGNTCYLNSLLQFYFTVSPLRERLEGFDSLNELAQKTDDDALTRKKVGGRVVPFGEVRRSQKFVGQLGKLFQEMIHTRDRYVVPSEELAYMALIPPQEDPEEENVEMQESEPESKDLNRMDLEVDHPGAPMSPPDESLYSAVPQQSALEGPSRLYLALQRQQDVTECIENVLFQLEAAVKATGYEEDGEQNDFVKDLFYGTTIQKLQNLDGSNKRVKTERFSSILVDVADGPRDIYDTLDNYFSHDVMELSEGKTERSITIGKLPPILQVQIQRVQFDRASGQPFKSLNPLFFDDVIYLDRYLETDDPEIILKREQLRELKARRIVIARRLEALGQREDNGLTRSENLGVCAAWLENWLTQHDEDGESEEKIRKTIETLVNTRTKLDLEQNELEVEHDQLSTAINSQFVNNKKHGYRIHSLFIHRGQVSFGHYWIYIQDFETGEFRKYNDEVITPVSRSEVFDHSEGNTATPYYLVFIREDFMDNIRSVVRDPEAAPVPAPVIDLGTPHSDEEPTEELVDDEEPTRELGINENELDTFVHPGNGAGTAASPIDLTHISSVPGYPTTNEPTQQSSSPQEPTSLIDLQEPERKSIDLT